MCALLFFVGGSDTSNAIQPVVAFASLGLLAYCLAHDLAKAAAGSVAFLPWLAALFAAPSGPTALVLAVAVALGELYRRKAPIKATFNVAQYTLSFALAASVYLLLGGVPLLGAESLNIPAYVASCAVFFATNGLSVAAVVGIAERRRVLDVWRETFKSNVLNDLIAIPVVYGFVLIYSKTGVLGIVVLAALLLGARQLYKTNAQLQITNRELLEVLVHAIELRDPYTSGHSQRVARYARIIGRAIGLSSKQVERLAIAALLHDVGKIDQVFVPILSKPGRLTPEERAIMELHPIKSAELVARVTELADVVLPVRHHHEAWDGSGYPDGLKGDQTPLLARVIVFADTIDAMTTDRPYRKAMGAAEVRAELYRCRGTQFDPAICDALLESPFFDLLFKEGENGPVVATPVNAGPPVSVLTASPVRVSTVS
jgi:HD-GYP domain-containing protein (c-di-GMP phosphodiesterase class II)